MSIRNLVLLIAGCSGLLLPGSSAALAAQAPAATAAASDAQSDDAAKAALLASDCWRRAMVELDRWLATQQVYSPEQVSQIKRDFTARVDKMSASELKFVLDDLEAKFQMLDTPKAREVRAWLGSYLAILSDRSREELLQKIPEFNTMDSAKLQQTISRLAMRRNARGNQNAQVQQLRNAPANPWTQTAPAAPRRTAPPATYRSPYRPASNQRPHEGFRQTRPSMSISPYGGLWMHLGF